MGEFRDVFFELQAKRPIVLIGPNLFFVDQGRSVGRLHKVSSIFALILLFCCLQNSNRNISEIGIYGHVTLLIKSKTSSSW